MYLLSTTAKKLKISLDNLLKSIILQSIPALSVMFLKFEVRFTGGILRILLELQQ
jgi:hypothetical protein